MPTVSASLKCSQRTPTSAPAKLAGLTGSFRATFGGSLGLPDSGLAVKLEWDSVEPVKILSGTIVHMGDYLYGRLEYPDGKCTLRESWFPPTRRGSIVLQTNATSSVDYTVALAIATPDYGLFTWERKIADIEKQTSPASLALEAAASHMTTLTHGQAPNNVCLDFLQLGRQLWASETSLVQISPHFKDILSSEFAEGTSSIADLSIKAAEHISREKDHQKPLAPFKRIPINDVPYSTYLAVLIWAQTSHITFAPLLSTFRRPGVDDAAASGARQDAVRALAETKSPLLPVPVSPKSVYRLADYLSLAPLKKLALNNLVSQLKPEIAAYELYSDVACGYDDVRDAVLEYVVEHWSEVKVSAATRAVEAAARELPLGAASTAMLLARRLTSK
ncbi:hypothetical protein JCM3775_002726 [Rhodotorula graminis]